jgi:hypothetical protein
VNIRNLVPALAIVTLTSTAGFAADAAPAVTFSGWVDTVLQFSDDDTTDNSTILGVTGKDEAAGALRFSGAASLKAAWKVTDKVSVMANLWFDPGSSAVNMREAYFTWAFNDSLSWSMGKYIDHIGWISAEPTGPTFLFINADTIGYRQVYGNDVLGTALNIAPKDSPVSGAIHITNGYFTGGDGSSTNYTSATSDNRENSDLGFGLDLTFKLPNELGSINAELAYDIHSGDTDYLGGPTPAADGLGGDVLMFGINATIKPVKIVTLGAEFMYLTVGESENAAGVSQNNGIDRMQFLLLGNVAIEAAPVPMSVSGLVQFISIDHDAPALTETEDRMYVGVALLTNPVTSSNFGLNFEVGYWDKTGIDGVAGAAGENNGLTVAVEGLLSF